MEVTKFNLGPILYAKLTIFYYFHCFFNVRTSHDYHHMTIQVLPVFKDGEFQGY